VTIYPITIYHRPQFGRDRIAAALPAAAVSSVRALSIALRFRRDVSVHLAKGAEKAAAALITDRKRDLLN
jgi:hypothetical protein